MVGIFPVNLEYLQIVDLNDPIQKERVDRTIDQDIGHLIGSNRLVLGTVLWEYSTKPRVQ